MLKYLQLFALFIILPCLFSACSSPGEKIIIGVILPISDSASRIEDIIEGLDMAGDEVNASGGINGKQLEIIPLHCGTGGESCKKVFNAIDKKHQPLFYITASSLITTEITPLAEKHSVVLISLVASDIDKSRNPSWTFSYHPTAREETDTIHQILHQLNIQSLGILYQDNSFGITHEAYLREMFIDLEIHTFSELFSSTNSDTISKDSPLLEVDAIYVTGFALNIQQMVIALRTHKFSGIVLTDSGLTGLDLTLREFRDVYLAASGIYNPNNIYSKTAKRHYEEKYNKPFTHLAASSYDIIKLIAGLLESKPLSRENVLQRLKSQFNYPGIFGYIEKQQGSINLSFPLYPARVVNGKIHFLQ